MTSKQDTRFAKTLVVDSELDSYKELFDFDWAKAFTKVTDNKAIREPAWNLTLSWRGVGNCFRLPWLMANQTRGVIKGFLSHNPPNGPGALRAVAARLERDLAGRISHDQAQLVLNLVSQMSEEAKLFSPRTLELIDVEEVWRTNMTQPEMKLSVWGSQQVCYSAIFFAYEAFLLDILRIKTGDAALRLWAHNAEDLFVSNFGRRTYETVWADEAINIARLARNAIAHNGAGETDQLKAVSHGIPVAEGRLHIMPDHNKALMNLLKNASMKLAKNYK